LSDFNQSFRNSDSRKVADIKSQENPFSGSRVDTWGETDGRRHGEAKRHFCDNANEHNISTLWNIAVTNIV